MKTINGFLFITLAIFACMHPPSWRPAAATQSSGMTTVTNAVAINGPSRAVFDLITTARFWPQWHPATKAVGGAVERPYGAGDLIHERGQVGNTEFTTTWKVVEQVPQSRVVLESQTAPARITYTFKPGEGVNTFTRTLEYETRNFAAVENAEQIMREQSETAVRQLKALVERILSEERKPLM
jgi:uncharacterized protein YndB with AHSA1/START domain